MEGKLILLFIACVYAETNSNETVSTTTVAPSTTAKLENTTVITPTDRICRACVCKDEAGLVDCNEQGLEKFFTMEDWAGLKTKKPLRVDLSNNPLTAVTPVVELPIEVFNLSRCNIATIEKASFKNLQNMRVLDLSHNKLTSDKLNPHVFEGRYSPEEYEPLASMRTLNLAYNDLHSLNQDLFEHLPELTELDLSGNPLTVIDHTTVIAIASLPMLKVLKLRSCQLSDIPDKFLHTPRYLERLDISDNKLRSVPQELEETKNLVYLNLNQNPIEMIDKYTEDFPGFPRLPKLEELHMCNMDKLHSIGEGALAGIINLKILHMCCNPRLSFIDPKALARADEIGETFDWPSVKEIYLQSNNLTEIDSRFLSRWDLVETFDLSGNPYMCDCSTQWMVDDLVPFIEKKKTNASIDMVCREPIEMRGITMKHLNENHKSMRCVDRYGHRPERDGAILLGTLIGVLLAVPIMLTIVLLWKRGYFAFCGIRGPADYSRAFYKRAPNEEFGH